VEMEVPEGSVLGEHHDDGQSLEEGI
jgi:hypothetical protein